MNCIIVDDDKVAQKAIEFLINQISGLNIIGIYDRVVDSLNTLQKKDADLIFLDIEMPEITGIDFLKNFGNLPQIIICSSKREYAADVFEYNVTDYLVKPITHERLLKAVNKAKEVQDNFTFIPDSSKTFFVKNKGNYLSVNSSDILYFEALADYVNIHSTCNRYTICSTMRAVEAKLSPKEFIRVHRSFIIRIDKITMIEEGAVILGEKVIPISKSYKKDLDSRLNFL